jgi:N-methylhydantoinase B
VKLVERGVRVRALYDLIGANVRDPASTMGDLDAQLAACRRGTARIEELFAVHGADAVLTGMRALLASTARRAEAAFRSWPAQAVEAEGFLDDEGFEGTPPVRVHARVQVSDGVLVVDLSGSSAQVASGMNVPISSAHAGTLFAVRAFLGPEVPQNAGLTSRVRVIAPEGTMFNPRFPAALSARHLAVQRLTDVLVEALSALLPDRTVAASHVSFPALVFQAIDPRSGRLTLLADILGGGGGARRHAPGDDGIDPYCSNCAILPAEIAELEYPWRIDRTELVDGSGGPGEMRGGLGLRRDYRLLAEAADGMYYVEQTNAAFAARGREGGGPGAPGRASIRRAGSAATEPIPGKGYIHLGRGDVLTLVGGGGGGFGAAPANGGAADNHSREES